MVCQVSYCQGMAFVAGVVLMYLPEEPAFQVLTRLMGPGGPDLRNLYLPGLEGLKQLLRCYEWLMERLMPQVKEHLEVGVSPMPLAPALSQNLLERWKGLTNLPCI